MEGIIKLLNGATFFDYHFGKFCFIGNLFCHKREYRYKYSSFP